MAGYGDLTAIKAMLELTGDDRRDARLDALNVALSAIFEDKVGRSWSGGAPTPRTVAIAAGTGPSWTYSGGYGSVLALPAPGIRALVSITVNPTWDGAAWTGGMAVDLADVQPTWQTRDGDYLGLAFGGASWPWASGVWYAGVWSGVVLVEAIWADQGGTAPPEVVEALNFLVAEEYKQEQASPESLSGPDGLAIRTRNPWAFTRVAAVIDKYRVAEEVAV